MPGIWMTLPPMAGFAASTLGTGLLDPAETCGTEQAFSCRIAYNATGSTSAGGLAELFLGRPLAVLVLIALGWTIRWVLHKAVDRLVDGAANGGKPKERSLLGRNGVTSLSTATGAGNATRRVQRARTMGSLLKSIVTGVVVAVVSIMAISELGYDVAPLIASAGVIGVALGFGSQSLVKDFLSGIFMIFEDQYGVGDVVDLGEASGTIEAVSLRVTRLRDVNGTVWYVRNGEILRVGNMSQNWARTVLDIPISYDEDLARVRVVLGEVAHEMWTDEAFRGLVIEEPEVWGVEALTPYCVTIRVTLKTAPMEQWAVAREMRERIKARLESEGIEIPRPMMTGDPGGVT